MTCAAKVLEHFKRFDADSSGAINREELGAVLKALDDTWTDESIDLLLSQADASGDGELQFKEFVSWVFAEGATGEDFTMVISGCPRKQMNGEYVQQKGKVFCGRPVFYCAANKRFLYYFKKTGCWQIFWKTKKMSSCRLATKRAPHLCGDAKWTVWKKDKEAFVEEAEMSCQVVVPETLETPEAVKAASEEASSKAPEIIRARQTNVFGTYSKRNTFRVDGRPLYFCSSDNTFLMYSEKVHKWKVCTVAAEDAEGSDAQIVADRVNTSREDFEYDEEYMPQYMKMDKRATDNILTEKKDWEEIARLGLGFSFPTAWSEETKAFSPEKATWHHPEEDYIIEWEVVNQKTVSASDSNSWTDPQFPPDRFSLGDPAGETFSDDKCHWIRAVDLVEDPVLFGEEDVSDVTQGGLGNCGMVTGIACFADFPGYLSSLFLTKEIPEDGKYQMRMFLPLTWENKTTEKKWETVEIDDFLPCKRPAKKGVLSSAQTWFTGIANGNKLYVCLLEKFFAKQVGSYMALKGFDTRKVWMALTGVEEYLCYTDMWSDQRDDPKYLKHPEWRVTAADGVPVYGDCSGAGPKGEKLGCLAEGATFKEAERKKYFVKFQKLSGEGPDEGWLPYFFQKSGTRAAVRTTKRWWLLYKKGYPEPPDMFQTLLEHDQANYPMSTCPQFRPNNGLDGMYFPHAYSILRVVEVNGFKMVCCRNPWGRGEWKGPWCESGNEWTVHPELAEALQVEEKDDGSFWMEWEDFQWNMGTIEVCPFSVPNAKAR